MSAGRSTRASVPTGPSRPLILGLAGGIGAGKSAVARRLADRGAVISDSDTEAKQALDRTAVRETLVGWWGPSILDERGLVDRKRIASFIFANEPERRRLEGLVHPLLKRARAALIAQAAADGVRVVVIDAPLLFEAGLDAECDAVLFVDCPREVRLERVRRSRGWDEAELTRRERAQLPLEEKRARADAVVVNDSDEATLDERVARAVTEIEQRVRAGGRQGQARDPG